MAEIGACYTNRDGVVVREKKVEEKAESHCFSRSWQSVCRSAPLEPSHLPLHSVWSHRPASPRGALSLSLFLSRRVLGLLNQPSNQPSKQQRKAPCTRTLETSTISFPLTYTADPFTACTRERIKPEQQTNTEERLQGWTMFGRGVARNRESDSFSLSNNYLSLNSIYRGDFSNKISN